MLKNPDLSFLLIPITTVGIRTETYETVLIRDYMYKPAKFTHEQGLEQAYCDSYTYKYVGIRK